MSRTTPRLRHIAALLLAGATAAGAAAPAAATPGDWLVGAHAGAATTRIARAHGARALALPGAYAVPRAHAHALTGALARRGLLRWSTPDVPLKRQSQVEGSDPASWARGPVVPAGLVPPAAPAPIGIVDDVVDTRVADVAQAKVLAKSPTQTLDTGHGAEVAHGTEVASVAAARADGAGVIGIVPGAPLLSYGFRTMSCQEVGDGILDLVDAGAKVINLSFATEEDCTYLRLATASAFGSGALVVAGAGNELTKGNPVVYPAAYPHVLSVGALDVDLTPAYFSSSGSALDLAAPGESVPVAVPLALDRDGTPDGTTLADGTSFAAPIVSGVASWLIGARPKLTPGQYADLLRSSAKDLGTPGWDPSTGFGLVNLAGALSAPVPAVDRSEPNDGIEFVDGAAFTKPDPYVWAGGAARTLSASVDPVEDPVDVYRIRLGARRRATVRLTPTAGNADLRVYDGSAKSTSGAKAIGKSSLGEGRTDTVHVTNRRTRARTFYVVVLAPSLQARTLDAPYTLKLSR
jgi:hypothetical protein